MTAIEIIDDCNGNPTAQVDLALGHEFSAAGLSNPITTREDDPCGTVCERHFVNGQLHREAGPALLKFAPGVDLILKEEYYRDGKLHRENGPAQITRMYDGSILLEAYFQNGEYYRVGGEPTYVIRQSDGTIVEKNYYTGPIGSRRLHRIGGPAREEFYGNQKKKSEEYYEEGQRHRGDGPACICWNNTGHVRRESFYERDRHIRSVQRSIREQMPEFFKALGL